MSFMSSPNSPSSKAMVFVDGSNMLIELGTVLSTAIRAEKPTSEQINLAGQTIAKTIREQLIQGPAGTHRVIRQYWFGSIQGDDEALHEKQQWLRAGGYEGVLFRKIKGKNEKGVDLAVAREMLIHGFTRNYDTAVLVAGDEDYLGLVQDLKRFGLVVVGMFYDGKALSPKLKMAFDQFLPLHHPGAVNSILAEAVVRQNAA